MINKIKKIALVSFLSVLAVSAQAQAQYTGLEEFMYRSGKIFTFLTVAGIVLFGILFYLMRIDFKLTKLEKQIKEQ